MVLAHLRFSAEAPDKRTAHALTLLALYESHPHRFAAVPIVDLLRRSGQAL